MKGYDIRRDPEGIMAGRKAYRDAGGDRVLGEHMVVPGRDRDDMSLALDAALTRRGIAKQDATDRVVRNHNYEDDAAYASNLGAPADAETAAFNLGRRPTDDEVRAFAARHEMTLMEDEQIPWDNDRYEQLRTFWNSVFKKYPFDENVSDTYRKTHYEQRH